MNIIGKKYKLIEKLGQGQFGSVCKAQCLKTNTYYAVKMESQDAYFSLLKHESTILFYLNNQKCTNIPHIFYYCVANPYTCMVLTYCETILDPSTMTINNKIYWWNTMLSAMEKMHKAGIVHRDLKPDHFMKKNDQWYIIDFGLATSFLENGIHIKETAKEHIVGTPNYVSYYVHEGRDVTRRDDFLSLVYIFMEIVYGTFLETFERKSEGDMTHINHAYNIWLHEQKEWDHIMTKLSQQSNDIVKTTLLSALIHVQHLGFNERPNYDTFTLSVE